MIVTENPEMAANRSWRDRYLDRYYRRRPGWVDGTTEFHGLCKDSIPSGARILEIGAGPSNRTSRFLAQIGPVTGIDPDPEVRQNDALAAAIVLEGTQFPLPDAAFDACVSDFVCEHIAEPSAHLAEVRRVLRPGGLYVLRTPNRYHYVALVSAATPHWFHRLTSNRLRALTANAHDVYPTHYRMNSARTLQRHAEQAGMTIVTLRFVEKEPSYAFIARPLFLAGVLYERAVNATSALESLRSALFVVLQRPLSAPPS